jgi:hypothetical protein
MPTPDLSARRTDTALAEGLFAAGWLFGIRLIEFAFCLAVPLLPKG